MLAEKTRQSGLFAACAVAITNRSSVAFSQARDSQFEVIVERDGFQIGHDNAYDEHRLRAGFRAWPVRQGAVGAGTPAACEPVQTASMYCLSPANFCLPRAAYAATFNNRRHQWIL